MTCFKLSARLVLIRDRGLRSRRKDVEKNQRCPMPNGGQAVARVFAVLKNMRHAQRKKTE
jgi:hypothetical protein